MSAALCFVIWCAVGEPDLAMRAIVAQDLYSKNEQTERFVWVETRGVFGGVVSNRSHWLPIVGMLPISGNYKRVRLAAGASLASQPVPVRGTRANWIARLTLSPLTSIEVSWLHVSNARSAIPNPSIDAIAIGVRF